MTPLEISEAQIRQHVGPTLWQRGEEYYRRGEALQAEVEGSDIVPYRVHVTLDREGPGRTGADPRDSHEPAPVRPRSAGPLAVARHTRQFAGAATGIPGVYFRAGVTSLELKSPNQIAAERNR